MRLKDLKVGDVIYIREDVNKPEKPWANKYDKPRLTGLQLIFKVDYKNGYFNILGELDNAVIERHSYTVEMIDWDKTRRLKINEGWKSIKKEVKGDGTFKEIAQSGESGNEITKAITHDGREIIIKNNNEENDIEKVVMLLMLKNLGVTYREIKREVEKVKIKWVPKRDEKYYWINSYTEIERYTWDGYDIDKKLLESGNCFKTKEGAERKAEEIKEVLRGDYDGK